MVKLTKKRTKIFLISICSILIVSILVLTGVAVGVKIGNKNKEKSEVNPLGFSIDVWDGKTSNANHFIESFAGRSNQTYTIDSASSFIHFVNEVNSGNTYEGETIYLNKNIDLKGNTINSIGSMEYPFKGTFDGGHYTIFNANIKGNGLFNQTENAGVKNVGLYNCNIMESLDSTHNDTTAGLIGKAKNTNISNVFVRLGSVEGNNVAGLVGEYVSTNGTNKITNSFADTELKGNNISGLVNKLSIDISKEAKVEIKNCYSNQDKQYFEVDNIECLTIENVIKPTGTSSFHNWDYNKEYSKGTSWTDYSYLEGTNQLSFNYPIQTGFVKVFMTGSFYEGVVVTNNGVIDASNLAQAFMEADCSVQVGSGIKEEINVNLLVEKVFVDSEAKVENNVEIKLNPLKDTTIIRGENNEKSFFVSTGESKITIGGSFDSAQDGKRNKATHTLTLDGNREYFEANNLDSGALVVSYGGEVEINENVVLQNNINTTGYGGAVLVYGGTSRPIVDSPVNNCHSEYGGGGLCFVGRTPEQLPSASNCSSNGNGGAILIVKELDNPQVVRALRENYGNNKSTQPIATQITEDTEITDKTYSGDISYSSHGGAIYIEAGNLTISGTTKFSTCRVYYGPSDGAFGGAIYSKNSSSIIYISGTVGFTGCYVETSDKGEQLRGGAIYGNVEILGGTVVFDGNYAKYTGDSASVSVRGGAIYGNVMIHEGDVTFSKNYCYSGEAYSGMWGGAIHGNVNILGGTILFSENYARNYQNAGGGAIYSTSDINITNATVTFDGNYAGAHDGDGGAINAVNLTITNSKVEFKNNYYSKEGRSNATIVGGAVKVVDCVMTNSEILFDNNFCGNTMNDSNYDVNLYGGGIYASNTLLFNSCTTTFSNNRVKYTYNGGSDVYKGGAIYAGTVTFTGGETTFTGNSAYTYDGTSVASGGAIYATNVSITDCPATFENNHATTSGGWKDGKTPSASGGAINATGNLVISDAEFIGNYVSVSDNGPAAVRGGAINAVVESITNCTFKNNYATSNYSEVNGGAINVLKDTNDTNPDIISGCVFESNSAYLGTNSGYAISGVMVYGGAISNASNLEVENSTFKNNVAYNRETTSESAGGAISSSNNLVVDGSTFSGNGVKGSYATASGDGIYIAGTGNAVDAGSISGSDFTQQNNAIEVGGSNNTVIGVGGGNTFNSNANDPDILLNNKNSSVRIDEDLSETITISKPSLTDYNNQTTTSGTHVIITKGEGEYDSDKIDVKEITDDKAINYDDISSGVGVVVSAVASPSLSVAFYYYDGQSHFAQFSGIDSSIMTIESNETHVEVGEYKSTIKLTVANKTFANGKRSLDYNWKIIYPKLTLMDDKGNETQIIYPKHATTEIYADEFGEEVTSLVIPEARIGNTFNGWYTNSDPSIQVIKVDGSLAENVKGVTLLSTWTLKQEYVLYESWSLNSYTVTLDPNGGEVDPQTVKVSYGAAYGKLPTPTRNGYEFVGWFSDVDNATEITDSTVVEVLNDHTLYAKWNVKSFIVTFDPNGGDMEDVSITVVFDSKYGTLPTTTKRGHEFIGWYTNSSFAIKIDSSSTVTIAKDHTLIAKWDVGQYVATISVVDEGNTNSTNVKLEKSGGSLSSNNISYSQTSSWSVTYNESGYILSVSAINKNDNYDFQIVVGDVVYDWGVTQVVWDSTSNINITIRVVQVYNISIYKGNGDLRLITNTRNGEWFEDESILTINGIHHNSKVILYSEHDENYYQFNGWFDSSELLNRVSNLNPYEFTITGNVVLYQSLLQV